MDRRMLEEVLSDQKNEMEKLMQTDFVYRREEDLVHLDSRMAQVVIGVRRSIESLPTDGIRFLFRHTHICLAHKHV